MVLGQDTVEKLAELARIRIDASQIPEVTERLSAILDMVNQMAEVNTDNVQAMSHPLDAEQRLRADEVTEVNQRDQFQEIAPSAEAGLYLVPRVVD